jgi:hypothetical protein
LESYGSYGVDIQGGYWIISIWNYLPPSDLLLSGFSL